MPELTEHHKKSSQIIRSSLTNESQGSADSGSRNVSVVVKVQKNDPNTFRNTPKRDKRDSSGGPPNAPKKRPRPFHERTFVDDNPAPFTHPMPYSFHRFSCKPPVNSMSKVGVRFPPAYVLFDNAVAVLWIFASAKNPHEIFQTLGIVQIQWVLYFLRTLRNNHGEYPVDVQNLITTFEDFSIMMYASLAPLVDQDSEMGRQSRSGSRSEYEVDEYGNRLGRNAGQGTDGYDTADSGQNTKKKKKCLFKCVPTKQNQDAPYLPAERQPVEKESLKMSTGEGVGKDGGNAGGPNPIYVWDGTTPKSLTYDELMNKYAATLEDALYDRQSSESHIDRNQYVSGPVTPGSAKDKSQDCPANCMYSRKVITNFLVSWRSEQMSKIDTELQRLRQIEKYMNAMDGKQDPLRSSQTLEDESKFSPKATSSPIKRSSFSN